MKKNQKSQFLRFLRKTLSLLFNPHFLLCNGLAWLLTNGWAYIFAGAGTYFDISWMLGVGSAYLALIWLPFTPEKVITTAIAILLLRLLLPNDQKTLGTLKSLHESAKEKWRNRKRKKKDSEGV